MIPIQIKSIHNHIQFDDNTFIQIISHYSIKLPDVASTGGEEGEDGEEEEEEGIAPSDSIGRR